MDEADDNSRNDHKGAYIFTPDQGEDAEPEAIPVERPSKRRKIKNGVVDRSKKAQDGEDTASALWPSFPTLLDGHEPPEHVSLRQQAFKETWAEVDESIKAVLGDSNSSTLDAVSTFIRTAPAELAVLNGDGQRGAVGEARVPAAFITTGANIAAQELLFEQLAVRLGKSTRTPDDTGAAAAGDQEDEDEEMEGASPPVVLLRSSEASHLKGTLKKIIRDATSTLGEGRKRLLEEEGSDDGEEIAVQNGRKYLDYDLEALHVFLQQKGSRQVVVGFQDSEAFDGDLLCDLIGLFSIWRNRIDFSLVFGIATSVELFQARLAKSTCRLLYGAQFDVTQSSSLLERIFHCAVYHRPKSALLLGPMLLGNIIERQENQVAGIQAFVSSIKYAYLRHFYSNPLSVLFQQGEKDSTKLLGPQHFQWARNQASFRNHVELLVEDGELEKARVLLQDDSAVGDEILDSIKASQASTLHLLRSVHILHASKLLDGKSLMSIYLEALSEGIELSSGEDDKALNVIRKMPVNELLALILRITQACSNGNADIGLAPWSLSQSKTLVATSKKLRALATRAEKAGLTLRSKYTAQNRRLRTTVVAQKVQLSKDTSALSPEDQEMTELTDQLCDIISAATKYTPWDDSNPFCQLWVVDVDSAEDRIFIPKPGTSFQSALSRPDEYLDTFDQISKSTILPITCILSTLYENAGALINVSDLWTAFCGIVLESSDDENQNDDDNNGTAVRLDERTALVLFYRGLAELKSMGYLKATRRKADHVAKIKWL